MRRALIIPWLFACVACAAAPHPSGDAANAKRAAVTPPVATQAPAVSPATAQGNTQNRRQLSAAEREQLNKLLLRSAEAGETGKISALLARGADANAVNSARVQRSPLTALMLAVVHGHVETARALIEGGADVNAKADFPEGGPVAPQKGVTALMQAAAAGDLPMVKLLVERGADVNAADGDGVTALMGARDGAVVAHLLEHKADPNARDERGDTALIHVVRNTRYGDREAAAAVRALLARGADPAAKNEAGETALGLAESAGKDDLVAIIRSAGGAR